MKKNPSVKWFAPALLAIMLLHSEIARAQYQVTGVTSSGGNIIEGFGTLPALGPGYPLSLNGGDQVTLAAGSLLISNPIAATTLEITNVRVVTETVLTGGLPPVVTFPVTVTQVSVLQAENGVSFNATGDSIANNGTIVVPNGGAGIYFANGDASTVTGPGAITVNGAGGFNSGIWMVSGNGAAVNISGPINIGGNGTGAGINFSSGNNTTIVDSGPININVAGQGYGLLFVAGNGSSVTTSGPITIAGQGYGMIFGSGNNAVVNTSSAINIQQGGYGIVFGGGDGAVVNNSGPISVLGGGPGGPPASVGISFGSGNNALVINRGPLLVTGGIEGIGFGSGNSATVINSAPVILESHIGASPGLGIVFGLRSPASGALLTNSSIVWVQGDGDSVVFFGGGNNNLTNTGLIGLSGHGNAVIMGGNDSTITNWGAIQGGLDNTAISVNGNNDIVNLNGHSAVNGKISITSQSGAPNTNIVNLNFTGVSPATLNNLKQQLLTQGVGNGIDVPSVIFTLRHVTYNIDPAVVNFNITSYQLQAVTPNQAAIGASLDSALVNPPPGSPLFNFFNAIDQSGNIPAVLQALSPQQYQAYGSLAIATSSLLASSIDARLNNLRDGSESIDTTGMGDATVAEVITGKSKDDSKEGKGSGMPPLVEPGTPDRWGFFASGDGLFFRGGNQLPGAKSNTAGALAGVDGKVGEHGVVGALFAYNNSAVTLDGAGSHATIQSYTPGIYGSYHQDGFYVNGLASYTRNDYNSQRSILFPSFGATANGSTNGNQYTVNLDGGYDYKVTSRLTVGPLTGLQYVHLNVDGFNESGAGPAGLALGSQSMDSLQSRLGGRVDYHIATTSTSSFAAELHAAWQHEFLDDSRGIGAAFQGAGLAPFSIQTTSPLRDAAVVGAGVSFTFKNRLTLFAQYELEYWRSSDFEETVSGGARISF